MTSSSSSSSSSGERRHKRHQKLSRKNPESWARFQVKLYASSCKYGFKAALTDPNTPEGIALSDKAKGYMLPMLDRQLAEACAFRPGNARALYDYLEQTFTREMLAEQRDLRDRYKDAKMSPDMDLEQYVTTHEHYEQQLKNAGYNFATCEWEMGLVEGLNSDYTQQVPSLLAVARHGLAGRDELYRQLRETASIFKRARKDASAAAAAAMAVAAMGAMQLGGPTCSKCHKQGHLRASCPLQQQQQQQRGGRGGGGRGGGRGGRQGGRGRGNGRGRGATNNGGGGAGGGGAGGGYQLASGVLVCAALTDR
jgi:hypothetical protein